MRSYSTRVCPTCGTEFHPWKDTSRFCSLKCKRFTITPLHERFWAKVEKSEGCWEWTAFRNADGYGRFRVEGTQWITAHRFSYELHFGPIPDGLCVLHRCDNPPCVRPGHLFLGTQTENIADRDRKGRQASGDRQGLRVHPDRAPRGERQHMHKLTDADVRELRRLRRDEGLTYSQLMKRFGVGKTCVSEVVSRHTWRHVED